jgi:predicted nucleic acid-binding protein
VKVIANTTIISNFAAVGRLDVLRGLLGQLYITTDVFAEIQDGMAEGYDFYAGIESQIYPLAQDGWLHLTSLDGNEELRFFSRLPSALHRGEASCLAVASQRGWAFLTDDARARAAASDCQVLVSGTLGILLKAVENELLSMEEADTLLNGMIEAGYHSPYASLADLYRV